MGYRQREVAEMIDSERALESIGGRQSLRDRHDTRVVQQDVDVHVLPESGFKACREGLDILQRRQVELQRRDAPRLCAGTAGRVFHIGRCAGSLRIRARSDLSWP